MKKTLICFMVGLVFFGACSAQKVNAQNVERRIIGTWVDNEGETWIFNANGNLTRINYDDKRYEYKFAVTDTQLVYGDSPFIFNISMSSDGKTLILVPARYDRDHYWLTRK